MPLAGGLTISARLNAYIQHELYVDVLATKIVACLICCSKGHPATKGSGVGSCTQAASLVACMLQCRQQMQQTIMQKEVVHSNRIAVDTTTKNDRGGVFFCD